MCVCVQTITQQFESPIPTHYVGWAPVGNSQPLSCADIVLCVCVFPLNISRSDMTLDVART